MRTDEQSHNNTLGPSWSAPVPHIFYVFGVKHDGWTDGIEMSGATHPVLISHNLSFTEFINLSQHSAITAIKQTDRSPAG